MKELKEEIAREMDVIHKSTGYAIINKETGQVDTGIIFTLKRDCTNSIKQYGLEKTHKAVKIKITWELV